MAGDRDMIPVAHTVEIWSAIPDAELCIVPGSDHFWLLENPALAIRTLLAFLLGQRA
jgi:pimeloyl-ACP methyl ester carboxylesterase